MSVEDAVDNAVVHAFGILRVNGGDVLVRYRIKGGKVIDSSFSEPDTRPTIFDEFKKAAGRRFVQDTPPEARWPEVLPS